MILAHRVRPRKTVENFMKLPEGTRAELIDGDIFMSPAPRLRRQAVVGNIYALLRQHVSQAKIGCVFVAPVDVHFPSGDIVQPDILFVARHNIRVLQDWVRGAPDLAVEVLSPENPERDLLVKRRLYAANGIREYWIVDPEAKAVEVLSLDGDQYQPAGYFHSEDVLASPLLPSFKPRILDFCEEQHT